eukprot:gene1735-46867_t
MRDTTTQRQRQHTSAAATTSSSSRSGGIVLLDRGARVDVVNDDSVTAVHAAILGGKLSAADHVLSAAERLGAAPRAALLSRATSVGRDTAVILAVREGMHDAVRRLVDAGAATAAANGAGQTALLLACKRNRPELACGVWGVESAELDEAALNCRERPAPHGTALLYAAGWGMAGVCAALLDKGADPR